MSDLGGEGGAAVRWGRVALAAYGPTGLSSIGFGAIIPLVALSALAYGASTGQAALIAALLGVGQLVGDLPAGWVAARLGEKRVIVVACLVDAASLAAMFEAQNLVVLAVGVFVCGMSGAVFGLARQAYLTEVVPVRFRARALSTLGGVFRIGGLIGPLAGAAIVTAWGLASAYVFAAGMSLLAAGVTLTLPDLPSDSAAVPGVRGPAMHQVLRQHAHVLLTQGAGALAIMLVRSSRQVILPLWCEAHGLSAAATSLVFSVSMACDVALFFLGGSLMDRFGRLWVALPAMVIMGLGLALLPFAHSVGWILADAALLGLGNGISSGVVMTLGSDASPTVGRTAFLAGWRLMGDAGNAAGPVVIGLVTGVCSLAWAPAVIALLAWGGAAWLWRWVPRRG